MLYISAESKGIRTLIFVVRPGQAHYFSTFTPFQNATYPAICFAAGFGSG
jgi:hypothetical protein